MKVLFVEIILLAFGLSVLAKNIHKEEKRSFYHGDTNKRGVTKKACPEMYLYAHNYVREHHEDTPPLEWSDKLAGDAQRYADELVHSNFQHARTSDGENLYTGPKSDKSSIPVAVFRWYDERNGFDYGKLGLYNFQGVGYMGHFTQMIWANTKLVGCAESHTSHTSVVVCRYDPPGNVPGSFDDYVKPVKGHFEVPRNIDNFNMCTKATDDSICAFYSPDSCGLYFVKEFCKKKCCC